VFFSASGSKLPSYILPLFPAAALIVGWQLQHASQALLFRLTWPLAAGTWIALGLAIYLFGTRVDQLAGATPAAVYERFYPYLAVALAAAAVGYSLATLAFRRAGEARRSAGIIGVSLATIVMLQIAFAGLDAFRVTRSAADMVTVLENEKNPPFDRGAPVYSVGMYDQTFPFYLRRPVTLVAYRDELALGLDAEPDKGIAHESDWLVTWRALPQGYAMLQQEEFDKLAARGLPYRIVARDPRRVLIARR
jgi:4-amino-4-deoxy-L-arabinose transferase-like glycosyltransferase